MKKQNCRRIERLMLVLVAAALADTYSESTASPASDRGC